MQKRRLRKTGAAVLLSLFLLIGKSRVSAGAVYAPLTVNLPASGEGSLILLPEDHAPEPLKDTVERKGNWTISFTEPGTYHYTAYSELSPSDEREVEISVINKTEEKNTELVRGAVTVFGPDGKKTDLTFSASKKEKKETFDPNAKSPKTEEEMSYQLLILGIAVSITGILFLGKSTKED